MVKKTGNKAVLSIRLALKSLPATVPAEAPPSAPSSKAAGKRKAEDAASSAEPKAAKTPNPNPLPKSSKKDLAAVDAADLSALKTADVKKMLNAHVKSLAHTVDRDWHDSYEETAEEACEWFKKCGRVVEAALRVGVGQGVGFDLCHEALKIVADTWSNINAIPFRGDVGEDVSNVDESIEVDLGGEEAGTYSLSCPEALVSLAWPCLLARAAADANVADASLLRMIKDAVDHGVPSPQLASDEEKELTSEGADVGDELEAGRARLASLHGARKAEWQSLASTKKKHNMRRGIDRRFDGPKHMRTRDYSDDDDGGYGFGFW